MSEPNEIEQWKMINKQDMKVKEHSIQLPSSIVKQMDEHLIEILYGQIKLCEAAVDWLHARLNEIQADPHLGKTLKWNLVANTQDKITELNHEIGNHMAAIRELSQELKMVQEGRFTA